MTEGTETEITEAPGTGFSSTVLTLSGVGVPPYSARGLQQTITPIGASVQLHRTINGALRDFSAPQFKKFSSVITGNDMDPPAVDGVWPGKEVTVACIAELAVAGSKSVFDRPAVAGSVRQEGGFTFYRPILTMRVVDFEVRRDEWGAAVSWTMELEEV